MKKSKFALTGFLNGLWLIFTLHALQDAHFGYPTVPMPSSSAFAAVIPEPISNDDFHDDDAAANDS